jgi:pimeloyl-ACP methyl ester carboxylesterase
MVYVDEGTGEAATFLLLHGEPVWSYMYRGAIPGLAAAGYRVIAPNNIDKGPSDSILRFAPSPLVIPTIELKSRIYSIETGNINVEIWHKLGTSEFKVSLCPD